MATIAIDLAEDVGCDSELMRNSAAGRWRHGARRL